MFEQLGTPVDWSDSLGLARAVIDDRETVVLYRPGERAAHVALVSGRDGRDVPELLRRADGDATAIRNGRRIDISERSLLPPVGRPERIVGIGLNYPLHAEESGRAPVGYPALFTKWPSCLTGPFADVVLPHESDQADFEAELVIVIGRAGRRIDPSNANRHVFGYTIANDGSVRDFQQHTSQVLAGKAWDGLTPLGPVVVPAHTVGGVAPDLEVVGLLDDEVVQRDRTTSLMFPVARLVSYVSTITTLEPGDLILTGTPAGTGFLRKPPVFLKPGSQFEARIEGIGALRNTFVRDDPS